MIAGGTPPNPEWLRAQKLTEIVAQVRASVQAHARARFNNEVVVQRVNLDSIMPGNTVALGHVLWMCDEITVFIREKRLEKADRWIGFMQGVLWLTGVASIDESRKINR